jgi:hypothetical protein
MERPISHIVDDMFCLGTLPRRVEMTGHFGPFRPGDVLEWSDPDRCYLDARQRWCLWALNVRQLLGISVRPATPVATQGTLFAA